MRFTKHRITFAPLQSPALAEADVVIPLDMDSVNYMTEHSSNFPLNQIPPPPADAVSLFHDKVAFNEWLLTSRFSSMAIQARTKIPFFLKPREGAWGDGCIVIDSPEEANRHTDKINSEAYLTSEILYSNCEYATHIAFRDGRIIAQLCIRYTFNTETAVKGVDAPQTKLVVKDPFIDDWAELLQETGYAGICCINYKSINGRPRIMEINPRFGGSLAEYFFAFLYPLTKGR